MLSVYVVGGDSSVKKMFWSAGYTVYDEATLTVESGQPDIVCFTGGADVNPAVYGEEVKGARDWDDQRDAFELMIYNRYVNRVPMVGICRGGQLLNVLQGGEMVQDHGLVTGVVDMWANPPEACVPVLVDHHQGMIAGPKGMTFWRKPLSKKVLDREAVDYLIFYPASRVICFQPHPEWGHQQTKTFFLNALEELI